MIEFRFARHRQWAILAGTCAMAVVFGWVAWHAEGRLRVYAGAAFVIFGVIAPAMHVPRMFMGDLALRIDEHGIDDRRMGCGLVRWDDMQRVAVRDAGLAKALEVYPKEPWSVVRRMTPLARPFAALNVIGGKPALLVQFQDVEPGFDEALKAIEVLAAAHGVR
ncbi:MAG: hypothetical protein HZA61_01885 [Candidatus Eisenbacteria bacterium]|uniref:PH domain-containing protein n=1 Tax=Eiseniibacteriota bacterium TaxID=2212470 RepID=A0A933SB57_UNCEI|nr:hypothetical protein [Candidatus Eisenbacteria bacterium]